MIRWRLKYLGTLPIEVALPVTDGEMLAKPVVTIDDPEYEVFADEVRRLLRFATGPYGHGLGRICAGYELNGALQGREFK